MIIYLLISLIVLAVIVALAIWAIRYMGGPEILVKAIIVLAVLFALIMLLNAFGWVGDWGLYHRPVIVR